jgi:hypothetical protein
VFRLFSLDDQVILDGDVPIWPKPSVFEGLTDKGTIEGKEAMQA